MQGSILKPFWKLSQAVNAMFQFLLKNLKKTEFIQKENNNSTYKSKLTFCYLCVNDPAKQDQWRNDTLDGTNVHKCS